VDKKGLKIYAKNICLFAIIFLNLTEVSMRFTLLICLALTVFLSGCYSSGQKKKKAEEEREQVFTVSPLCPTRNNENKFRRQTVDQMRKSRKIPSVDFEFDSIILKPDGYEVLDKVAAIMTSNRSFKLIIEGHSDQVGTDEYNDWLSSARANAIKSYLVSRDVYGDSITTHGYGKSRPLTNDDSAEGRACNRRVAFTLTTRDWKTVY
jgi:outer membrane protein OmpA-like peptidoglycan-associated protein